MREIPLIWWLVIPTVVVLRRILICHGGRRELGVPSQQHGDQFIDGLLDVVIDEDVVEISGSGSVVHLAGSIVQARPNRVFRFRPPSPEPGFKRIQRGWRHKDVFGGNPRVPDGPDPLDVDIENGNLGVLLERFEGVLAGAVVVSVHDCVFYKVPVGNVGLEFLGSREKIVPPVDFAGSWRPRRVRDTKSKCIWREALAEGLDEGALADARGPTHYQRFEIGSASFRCQQRIVGGIVATAIVDGTSICILVLPAIVVSIVATVEAAFPPNCSIIIIVIDGPTMYPLRARILALYKSCRRSKLYEQRRPNQ